MSDRAKEALALYRSLTAEEKQQFRTELVNDPDNPEVILPARWLTFSLAAAILERNKSTITRLVDRGWLISNGKSGRQRKVRADSVARLKVELDKYRIRRTAVEARVKRHILSRRLQKRSDHIGWKEEADLQNAAWDKAERSSWRAVAQLELTWPQR